MLRRNIPVAFSQSLGTGAGWLECDGASYGAKVTAHSGIVSAGVTVSGVQGGGHAGAVTYGTVQVGT